MCFSYKIILHFLNKNYFFLVLHGIKPFVFQEQKMWLKPVVTDSVDKVK